VLLDGPLTETCDDSSNNHLWRLEVGHQLCELGNLLSKSYTKSRSLKNSTGTDQEHG
jgi:hypothetical protein